MYSKSLVWLTSFADILKSMIKVVVCVRCRIVAFMSVLILSIDENYFRRQILLDSAYLCTYVPLSVLSCSSLFQDLFCMMHLCSVCAFCNVLYVRMLIQSHVE